MWELHTEGEWAALELFPGASVKGLTPELLPMLPDAVRAAEQMPGVKSLLLAGGARQFCIGATAEYLSHLARSTRGERLEHLKSGQRWITALLESNLRSVALLRGSVSGFGIDLCMACDVRVADSSVSMASAYDRLGLVPDGGGLLLVSRLSSLEFATDFFAGRRSWNDRDLMLAGLVHASIPDLEGTPESLIGEASSLIGPCRANFAACKGLARSLDTEELRAHLDECAEIQADLIPKIDPKLLNLLSRLQSV
ncbi:MAG: hypothetical protein CMQ43_01480 [Gammaproteobacteria bacterium]|nr:hypothetical protein [Gammaproteobacteria bacterium]|tara:strand:- start:9417 stop:10178 length:762 start_codon:yes stop_codon:yes gene_type:complete